MPKFIEPIFKEAISGPARSCQPLFQRHPEPAASRDIHNHITILRVLIHVINRTDIL